MIAGLGVGVAIGTACGGGGSVVEIVRIPAEAGDSPAQEGGGTTDAPSDGPCVGPACTEPCPPGKETTIEGNVYAPDGKLKLFNAIVYAPTAALAPIVHGPTCERCGTVSGDPVATAVTDSSGYFVLKNAPDGKDVPLVIQSGKWRRLIKVPTVQRCVKTVLDDKDVFRLPKNKTEGDIPRIAVASGGCDGVPCLFTKLGIDLSEIGVASDGAAKSVHLYRAGGGLGPPAMADAETLWSDPTKLAGYDLVIMGCECSENLENKGGAPGAPPFAVVTNWLNAGGRLLTHDHAHPWLKYSSDPDIAGAVNIPGGGTAIPDASLAFSSGFPKASALSNWWRTVATSGDLSARATLGANVASVDTSKVQVWANGGDGRPEPRVFSFTTPLSATPASRCGRAMHIDAHTRTQFQQVTSSYPSGCDTEYSSSPGMSEKLLAFALFEVGSCIQDDKLSPVVPKKK